MGIVSRSRTWGKGLVTAVEGRPPRIGDRAGAGGRRQDCGTRDVASWVSSRFSSGSRPDGCGAWKARSHRRPHPAALTLQKRLGPLFLAGLSMLDAVTEFTGVHWVRGS